MDEYVAWFIGGKTYIKRNDEPFIVFEAEIKAEDALGIAALLNAAQQNVQADEGYCDANCIDDPNKIGWVFCPYCGKRLRR